MYKKRKFIEMLKFARMVELVVTLCLSRSIHGVWGFESLSEYKK